MLSQSVTHRVDYLFRNLFLSRSDSIATSTKPTPTPSKMNANISFFITPSPIPMMIAPTNAIPLGYCALKTLLFFLLAMLNPNLYNQVYSKLYTITIVPKQLNTERAICQVVASYHSRVFD